MSWWESCRSFSLDWRHWLVKCVVTELLRMMWNPFPNVHLYIPCYGFPGGSRGKESAFNEGDLGLISGLRRFSGKGKGYPLQYFCLENSMDTGSWWATVCGVTKSWTFSLSAMLKVCWFLFFFLQTFILSGLPFANASWMIINYQPSWFTFSRLLLRLNIFSFVIFIAEELLILKTYIWQSAEKRKKRL